MEETLRSLLKETKKKKVWSMITALCMMGIFVVVLVGALILIPKVDMLVGHADSAILTANASFEELQQTTEDMEKFYNDNANTLSEAMVKIRDIDYDSLNKAIHELQNAVEPFSNFADLFKK